MRINLFILVITILCFTKEIGAHADSVRANNIRLMVAPISSYILLGFSGYVEWAIKDKFIGIEIPLNYSNNKNIEVRGIGMRINKYLTNSHYGLHLKTGFHYLNSTGNSRTHAFSYILMWGYKLNNKTMPFHCDLSFGLMYFDMGEYKEGQGETEGHIGLIPALRSFELAITSNHCHHNTLEFYVRTGYSTETPK
jgi:hypothetical protein